MQEKQTSHKRGNGYSHTSIKKWGSHTINQGNSLFQLAKILKSDNTKVWQGDGATETLRQYHLYTYSGDICITTLENDLATSSKVKDAHTLCTSNLPLGTNSREAVKYAQEDIPHTATLLNSKAC